MPTTPAEMYEYNQLTCGLSSGCSSLLLPVPPPMGSRVNRPTGGPRGSTWCLSCGTPANFDFVVANDVKNADPDTAPQRICRTTPQDSLLSS